RKLYMPAGHAPPFEAPLHAGVRPGKLTFAQHGEAFARWDQHIVEHGDPVFTPDAFGLVASSQQPIGLAPVVEDVCPPCQGPTNVERMPQPARISILLVAHLRSLVGVAQHPERLRREDTDSRSNIISCRLAPSRGRVRSVVDM